MLTFLAPVENARAVLGSRFGRRTDPVTGAPGAWHNGVDLRVPLGTPLRALTDGHVTFAGPLASSPDSGVALGVDAGGGWSWSFSHLTSPTVRVGERVTAGQLVAYSGSTGKSTGPHLHLTIRRRGDAVDPVPLILAGAGALGALALAALGVWAAT